MEQEGVPLRQSHDFELDGHHRAMDDLNKLGTVVAEGENWQAEAVELETQFELIERHGNGLGLAFAVGYGWATELKTAERNKNSSRSWNWPRANSC